MESFELEAAGMALRAVLLQHMNQRDIEGEAYRLLARGMGPLAAFPFTRLLGRGLVILRGRLNRRR